MLALAALGGLPRVGRAQASGWRSNGTGIEPDARPVAGWSLKRNLLWTSPMPSWSNATPVVVGDRLFAPSEPTTLLAVDTGSGEIVWSRDVTYLQTLPPSERDQAVRALSEAEGIRERTDKLRQEARLAKREARRGREPAGIYARLEAISRELETLTGRLDATARHVLPEIPFVGYSSATPVTDGEHVYVVFANGVAAAFDLEGNARWTVWIGPPAKLPLGYKHGQAASPLLIGDRLIVGLGRLTALDKRTGEVLWRGPEYRHFGTPRSAHIDGRDVVVTPGGEVSDAATGELLAPTGPELWFVGPVVEGSRVFFVGNKNDRDVRARALDLRPKGANLAWESLWERSLDPGHHLNEPLVHDGLLYTINEEATFYVLDAADGRTVYRETLPLGEVYSSFSLAGDLLFITDKSATTLVLRPGRTYQRVARSRLQESIRASLVFVDERIYLRGVKQLYAIGAPEGAP